MNNTQFNIQDYANAMRRRLPLFLKIALPVTFAAIILATVLPDMFRSSAEFRIDLEGPNIDVLEPIYPQSGETRSEIARRAHHAVAARVAATAD